MFIGKLQATIVGPSDLAAAVAAADDFTTIDCCGKDYTVSSLQFPAGKNYVTLKNATINFSADSDCITVAFGSPMNWLRLENVHITATNHTTAGRKIIDYSNMSQFRFVDVWTLGVAGKSTHYYGAGGNGTSPYYGSWEGCYMGGMQYGIKAVDAIAAMGPNGNRVDNCRIQPGSGNTGIYLGDNSQNFVITGGRFESAGGIGIDCRGTGHGVFGTYFESMTTGIVCSTGSTKNKGYNVQFDSCSTNINYNGTTATNNFGL